MALAGEFRVSTKSTPFHSSAQRRRMYDERGASFLESALIITLIALFALMPVMRTGEKIKTVFCLLSDTATLPGGQGWSPACQSFEEP